jgi:hypothetical protein
MKYSDQCWLDSMAQDAMGITPSRHDTPLTTYGQSIQIFLDELCELMSQFIAGFNQRVEETRPDLVFQIFRMGYGKPGVILLRNKDKLVISGDGGRIHVKVVRVHAYNERSLDVLEFFAAPFDGRGNMIWKDARTNQIVTPELVVKCYLTAFFIKGSMAYLPEENERDREARP